MSSIRLPHIMITEEMMDGLTKYLEDNPGIGRSYLMREAIREYLEKHGDIIIEDAHPQVGGIRKK